MLKRYFLNNKKRNFSTASIWIKGGSDVDSIGKKGINKILSSLLTRGCEGFNNFENYLKYWDNMDNFKEIIHYIQDEKFTLIASSD